MKNSNMFSDYMVAQSVNRSIRSINHSPTSGTVHRQRNSYGPRLTLLSKSNDTSPIKQGLKQAQSQQYIEKILLLSLQISRLNNLNDALKNGNGSYINQQMYSSKINGSKQVTLLKQSNETLKIAIKTLQSSLMKGEQQKNKMKVSYQSRINELQIELNNYVWKVQQNQKQLQKMRKDKYEIQIQMQKLSVQKSRNQMNQSKLMHMQMQRSIQAQKNYQISLLKQSISKLQTTVGEYRSQIKYLREQNQKLANKQAQLLLINNEYVSEFEQIKKRINYDLIDVGINTVTTISDMIKYESIYSEYKQLKNRLYSLQIQLRQKQQLSNDKKQIIDQKQILIRDKQLIIRERQNRIKDQQNIILQLKQNNNDFRSKYQDLLNQYNQKQFYSHQHIIKIQSQAKLQYKRLELDIIEIKQQLQKIIIENDLLKQIINQQKQTIQLKNIENVNLNIQLNNKIKKTQRKLKHAQRLSSNKKDIENIYMLNHQLPTSPQTRLFKSRSIQSTSFFMNRKGIDISLQSIVTNTVALQGSNQRSLRLINKSQQKLLTSCMSPIKNKRKVFIATNRDLNNNRDLSYNKDLSYNRDLSKQSSDISQYQAQKKTKHRYRKSNNKQDQNMKSSIHEYYGQLNA